MKRFISMLLIATLITLSLGNVYTNASTSSLHTQLNIEELNNGDYFETVIMDIPSDNPLISTLSTNKTITKTKTSYYKNSKGTVLWSVSIKATFTYNGSTSKCTSCSHSTTAPAPSWSIKSSSSGKSGNSATANATAVRTATNGTTNTVTKSVTIKCSPNGTVS